MHIAPDEKIETFELDYDGKRDRWNGYDPATYARVIERYEAREEARRKYLKEQQLKKLEKNNKKQRGENESSDDDEYEDEDAHALKVDEAKVDESKQADFAKVEKRVRTTGGGSTGTVRCAALLFVFVFLFVCYVCSTSESVSHANSFTQNNVVLCDYYSDSICLLQKLAYPRGHCKIPSES